MKIIQTITTLLTGNPGTKRPDRRLSRRELIEQEAEIGGRLFGPIPDGHRREFFNLDANTWVWHEEWIDEVGIRQVTSTRYEVHENGILKAQDGKVYKFIEGDELRNLSLAIQLYYEKVSRDIYHRDPVTGQKLTETPATL